MSADALVVGGGLIGLATAWRAARAGLRVTVVDQSPGTGASHVAAGMLAPVTEVAYGEESLLDLTIASARRWPAFARDLEAVAGPIGYRPVGTLLVGLDADDLRVLEDLHEFHSHLGLGGQRLASRACRQREPLLSPRVRGGILADEDHQVEPRRVVAALLEAARRAGVEFVAGRVAALRHDGTDVEGVALDDGRVLRSPRVVLAAGCWSGRIAGVPEVARPAVRPVKGQVLHLRSPDGAPLLSAAVRGIVRGRSVYLVPRGDGRVVVGATQEERGYDTTVTAGATRTLLDDAARIVPAVDETELTETIAGLRPGTPDNRPMIGTTDLGGLILATGHHRNGVLLTPVTAEAVCALLVGEEPDPVVAVADPRRSAPARAAAAAGGSP